MAAPRIPGPDGWPQWTLVDREGTELVTEEQRFVFLDGRYSWQQRTRGPVTAYWYGRSDDAANLALESAANSLRDTEELLQATNDSVIKLNHVIHHGSIGHHVQNWHAFRSASRIGQVAAVDCASRIAMFCGGTMAEGWACYATDLMR